MHTNCIKSRFSQLTIWLKGQPPLSIPNIDELPCVLDILSTLHRQYMQLRV